MGCCHIALAVPGWHSVTNDWWHPRCDSVVVMLASGTTRTLCGPAACCVLLSGGPLNAAPHVLCKLPFTTAVLRVCTSSTPFPLVILPPISPPPSPN